MIPYGHQSIDETDIDAVVAVLRSDWLTRGPKVEEFEKALAAYTGAAQAVTFTSGTLSLHAACFALGLKPGDEYITTPMTFAATANAGLWFGGIPVFVDIDPATGNIDPEKIEAAVTSRTRAIIPVDYAGQPANSARIREIADAHKLFVVEDACHALGASVSGQKVGNLAADMTVFSFHPVKPLTTGEGGAVVTNNPEFAHRLRMFRNHGVERNNLVHPADGAWYYEMQELALNAWMTDIQAALGLNQLRKLDSFIEARARIARQYSERLAHLKNLRLPIEREGVQSGWHIYPIRLVGDWSTRRKEVFDRLREAGIGVQVHYIPVYQHPYYERLGYKRGLCPEAEAFYATEISLPIHPTLAPDDQEKVIQTLIGIFKS